MSTHATYLSQLCDEKCYSNYDEFKTTLTLSLLFFDRISLSAASLLGHPFFYQLTQETTDTVELYKSFISPIMFDQNESFQHLHDNFKRFNTINRLGTYDKLLEHAKFIDSCRISVIRSSDQLARQSYADNMQKVCTYLSENQFPIFGEKVPQAVLLRLFKEAFLANPDRHLRCSNLYRIIENQYSEFSYNLKVLCDIVFQYSISESVSQYKNSSIQAKCSFSSDAVSGSIIEILQNVSNACYKGDRMRENQLEIEHYTFNFPILEMPSIPMSAILELRKQQPFKSIRKMCNDFRYSEATQLSSKKFASKFEECKLLLDEYFLHDEKTNRKTISKQNNVGQVMLKFFYNTVSPALPIAITLVPIDDPCLKGAIHYGACILIKCLESHHHMFLQDHVMLKHKHHKIPIIVHPDFNHNIKYSVLSGKV